MNIYIPYNFMFILLMMTGTIFSISSSNWMGVWAGMEINLLGFMPILIYKSSTMEIESSVKYFIIQSMSSSILLMSSIMINTQSMTWTNLNSPMNWNLYTNSSASFLIMSSILLLISLLMKLGMSPFHYWLPSVMAGLSWIPAMILTSWQKIAPMMFIIMTSKKLSYLLLLFCVMSSIIGGIGGLNQTQLRALLAYSSINHLGWMVAGGMINMSSMLLYFMIYFMISFSMFFYLWMKEKSQIRQLSSLMFNSLNEKLMLILSILSLSGMPPLLGFIPKWIIMTELSKIEPMILLFLILGSTISMFFYLTLFFSFFFNNNIKIHLPSKISNHLLMNYSIIIPIIFNITGTLTLLWMPQFII